MTMGTNDRKKVVILVGLLVVAAIVFWINSGGEEGTTAPPAAQGPRPVAPMVAPRRGDAPARAQTASPAQTAGRGRVLQEFRPSLKPRRPEDRPDPMSLDPQLRTDVLAKLQNVSVQGSNRNIFDFSQAPPPKTVETAAAKPPVPSPIVGAEGTPDGAPATPPPPPPPPKVPLKFFGFVAAQAQGPAKRAFFLEGEDIHVVSEGDVVKKRYRIVRIGVNSVVVEDIGHENNQQTLPLEEAPAG
jgi:hypothetical protein